MHWFCSTIFSTHLKLLNIGFHMDRSPQSSSSRAYGLAIDLLPQLVVQSEIQKRQDTLSRANSLACDCASVCIQQGVPELAVEFLEEGRGTFWSRALQPRNALEELRSIAPGLANRVIVTSSLLENMSARDISKRMYAHQQPTQAKDSEGKGAEFSLDDIWEQMLGDVRQRNQSDDFAHPSLHRKAFPALQESALHGPVVIVNASGWACDGLIITMGGVKHVPFPGLSPQQVKTMCIMLRAALQRGSTPLMTGDLDAAHDMFQSLVAKLRDGDQSRHGGPYEEKEVDPEGIYRDILHTLWVNVAQPVIQALDLQVGLM